MKRWVAAAVVFLSVSAKSEITGLVTFPGGSDGGVQYNCDYTFCAESTFSYDEDTNTLSVSSASISFATVSTGAFTSIRWSDGTVQVSSPSASGSSSGDVSTGTVLSGGDAGSVVFLDDSSKFTTDTGFYFSTSSNVLSVPFLYANNSAQFNGGINLSNGGMSVSSGNDIDLANGASVSGSTGATVSLLGVVTATNTGNSFGGSGALLTAIPDGAIASGSDLLKRQITAVIDGGGSTITTGAKKVYARIPYNMTVTGWDIVADQAGAIVVDVWMEEYGSFPPTVSDSIAGTEKPTLSGPAQKNQDTSLSSFSTSLVAGEYLEFNVDSVSTVTKVVIHIYGVIN